MSGRASKVPLGRAALAVAAWLGLVAVVPLAAAQQTPQVTVEPTTVAVGETLTVRGAGWPAGATLSATIYEAGSVGSPSASVGATSPDASGNFSLQTTVPDTLFDSSAGPRSSLYVVPGQYTLLVRSGSDLSVPVSFTVGAPPEKAILWGDIAFDVSDNGVRDAGDLLVGWGGAITASGPTSNGLPKLGVTDARGRYLYLGLLPGTYSLQAQAEHQNIPWNTSGSIAVEERQALRLDLLLRRQVPLGTDVPRDERYYPQTRFRIDDDQIWSYFNARGSIDVFGFPVSRSFVLLGCKVQMFQRQIAQVCADGQVRLMNVLDYDIFPFTRVNTASFPEANESMKRGTPGLDEADYDTRMLAFIQANAPDVYSGVAVKFGSTFFGLITEEMAGTSEPGLLAMMNLEVWGAPISPPAFDPNNSDFIYQRFQRGIMHHIAPQGVTRGILLADYLKAIMQDSTALPADLRAQAQDNRFFAQYCPGKERWLCKSHLLPGTDLSYAFEQA